MTNKLADYTNKLKELGLVESQQLNQLSERFNCFLETLPLRYLEIIDSSEHAMHDFKNIKNPIKYK
ncbi:hypothetical protein AD998_01865 [bacterium 336/3]|nr:hypothetical protein AD998_01865 [bacterium 336/3]